MDNTFRADDPAEVHRRRGQLGPTIEANAFKFDQAANWKDWVAVLGIRMSRLRHLFGNGINIVFLGGNVHYL